MTQEFDNVQHENEIITTRVGGLGGSDAAMVYKVGLNGLSALNAADIRRLAVLTGQAEQTNTYCSAEMQAGHLFEDFCESQIAVRIDEEHGYKLEREKFLEADLILGLQFRTFAHADFYEPTHAAVIECKYSKFETSEVRKKYNAQLQWYYLLGAKRVALCHGWGSVEPFKVEDCDMTFVERNDKDMEILRNGLRLISGYLQDFKYQEPDKLNGLANMPEQYAICCRELERAAKMAKQAAKITEQARDKIRQYMEDNNIVKIDTGGTIITYKCASTRNDFDKKKAVNDYPELAGAKYIKPVQVKSSISIEVKQNEESEQ